MSEIVRLSVALTLRSPFMFQGLANAMLGIDAAHLRDERGRPIIPADQIKGVLKAACVVLEKHAPSLAPDVKRTPNDRPKRLLERLFGAVSPDHIENNFESYDRPDRGLLIAGDLAASLPEKSELTTTRIEIDDETGAVKSGALQVVELVAPFGKEVEFTGTFTLLAEDGVDPERAETLLSRALALVPAIGAFKSAGFGEVTASKVKIAADPKDAALPGGGTIQEDRLRLAYRVTFDRPILVNAERVTDNLFAGAAVVPGAAFKGALAGMMKLAVADPEAGGDWGKSLAALRISHAFPENDDGELSGLPLPASLLSWPDGGETNFADALLLGDLSPQVPVSGFTTMVRDPEDNTLRPMAPLHPLDWKGDSFSDGRRFPKPVGLPPQPRTHVSIGADTLVAKDQDLFTTVAQGVLLKDRTTERKWRVVMDFQDVENPEHRAILRQLIEGGLVPVGRTGAFACFKPVTMDDPPNDAKRLGRLRLAQAPGALAVAGHPDLYALTLVTPALLTDPQSEASIEQQYKCHIEVATGGTLLRHYTIRRLAGGYIATRRRPYGKTYYPFVLTDAGSVFLIKGGDAAKLASIARSGLPPVVLSNAEPLTWKNCPYLRENGYGEAAFSLVDHANLAAEASHV